MSSLKKYLWFFAILLAGSCQKETDDPVDNAGVSKMDVAYGNDPKQKLDYYLPAGRSTSTTKVIILIHGGGWIDGDKADFSDYFAPLKLKLPDYAIFNINYRLEGNGSNLFPAQENDVKSALEFIYNKRSEFTVSDKFVLLGASAGGHLALLQAYKYDAPVKAKAVVSFFGPTDLKTLFSSSLPAASLLNTVTGGTPVSHAELYRQSSPVTFVKAQSPPTLLLQGGVDPLVPPVQSESLKSLLDNAGVINKYVFYPTEAHGWVGANLNDSFDKITEFLTTQVK